jgi:hypothetical protein
MVSKTGVNVTEQTTSLPKFLIMTAMIVPVMVLFTIWGGVPEGQTTAFGIGIAVLVAGVVGFLMLSWHLLYRPLPVGVKQPSIRPIPARTRQALAALLGVGALAIVIGGFWDEVWHRLYSLPFGDDFFWRPHLLMYFGFLVVTLVGFGGLYLISARGRGTFQQRFRANPLVGMLVLVALLLMVVLPADPIWHGIYGADLTAWSIPHQLLFVSFVMIMLVTTVIQLSLVPARPWRSVLHLNGYDVLPILMNAAILMGPLQLFTTDWYQVDQIGFIRQMRPDWVLMAITVAIATFAGMVAARSLRMFGAAALIGVLALAFRYIFIQVFEAQQVMTISAWVLALPPLIALDVWLARARRRDGSRWWMEAAVMGAAGLLISMPLMGQLYPYLNASISVVAVVGIGLAAVCAAWLGGQVGDGLAAAPRQVEAERSGARLMAIPVGALAAMVAFMVFFISTATPPV